MLVSRDSVQKQILLEGVVCICGFAEDDWQLCLDYRDALGGEPAVVAFDEENQCYRLAETFDEFVAGLTLPIKEYVYAPQGVLGKAVDGVLSNLSSALGSQWQPHASEADAYVMRHPTWHSPAGGPGDIRATVQRQESGRKRAAAFPETWSYRVLHCAIHPCHRAELERCLSRTEYKWLLLHEPEIQSSAY